MCAEEGTESVQKSEEVGWLGGGGWVEGWREDRGDHQAVDSSRWGAGEGCLEASEDVLEGRPGA